MFSFLLELSLCFELDSSLCLLELEELCLSCLSLSFSLSLSLSRCLSLSLCLSLSRCSEEECLLELLELDLCLSDELLCLSEELWCLSLLDEELPSLCLELEWPSLCRSRSLSWELDLCLCELELEEWCLELDELCLDELCLSERCLSELELCLSLLELEWCLSELELCLDDEWWLLSLCLELSALSGSLPLLSSGYPFTCPFWSMWFNTSPSFKSD